MMKTYKIFPLFLISGFLYVSCTEKVTSETGNEEAGGDAVSKTDSKSAPANTAGYSSDLPRTTVEATGSAKTRDGALVDACRLAVAQVHGGLISGSLLKTNEVRGDLVIGSTFEETRDSSTLSFGGLLLNYKVISQTEPTSEGGVWKNTAVKANEESDLYLMTGYDHKEVSLTADKDVEITLLVHNTHYS